MDHDKQQPAISRGLEGAVHRELTRKEFLKVATTDVAGATLLGASTLPSSCSPQLSRKTKPNVILVVIDSLRKDHIGAYGNSWIKTPNIDALTRESLRFSRAYPESLPTICAPAHLRRLRPCLRSRSTASPYPRPRRPIPLNEPTLFLSARAQSVANPR
jgi:Sulfatase